MKNQEHIGELLFLNREDFKEHGTEISMSEIADVVYQSPDFKELPDNPKDFQHDYAKAYKEELRNNPDKHAQEMLKAIERGEKLGEDPSGT